MLPLQNDVEVSKMACWKVLSDEFQGEQARKCVFPYMYYAVKIGKLCLRPSFIPRSSLLTAHCLRILEFFPRHSWWLISHHQEKWHAWLVVVLVFLFSIHFIMMGTEPAAGITKFGEIVPRITGSSVSAIIWSLLIIILLVSISMTKLASSYHGQHESHGHPFRLQ